MNQLSSLRTHRCCAREGSYGSVVEHLSCKQKVLSSILSGSYVFFCFGRVGPRGSGIYPKNNASASHDSVIDDAGAYIAGTATLADRINPPYLQHIQSITSVHPRNNKA